MFIIRNFRFRGLILLITVALFVVGCAPEKKLGSDYLIKRQNITMVIRVPKWVKMVNLTTDTINYPFWPTQRGRDSIKFYNSKLLQDLTDSTIIGNYIKSLKENFESQGYKTLIVSENDKVFPIKQNAFLINIGQIELDENSIPIRDETRYNSKLFGADYDQAKVEMNVWIEVSKIVDSIAIEPTRLLYDAFEISDMAEGNFKWDSETNRMNYTLKKDEILPKDVYDMVYYWESIMLSGSTIIC